MQRDYRLYELSDEEFEKLVVQVCVRWFGQGVTPFAPGKDGGRDARFYGTANSFPSSAEPIQGHCVVQAKHSSTANKSCSDRDFEKLLSAEYPKIMALVADGICDHYIVFTNRKLTGGADKKLIAAIQKQGVKTAFIVGVERLNLALEEFADLRNSLPNHNDHTPFRFDADDIVEVIGALHDYTATDPNSGFNSAVDFESIKIRDEKNKINDLTEKYYNELIVNGSMLHFSHLEDFLRNPRNTEFAALYHDAADELKEKILVNRAKFGVFDGVFAFLSEHIQRKRTALRGKRRLVNVLLHYMYFNCDIGSKHMPVTKAPSDADS